MVEKIEVWEVGLMICLDQGLRRSVCMSNLNYVEKKMNSEYVVENVLKIYGRYWLEMLGTQRYIEYTRCRLRKKYMVLPLGDQRHEWLRFDAQGYTKKEKQEFETQLAKIYYWKIHRVDVLNFARLGEINEEVRELLGIHGSLVREVILEFLSTLGFKEDILDLDIADTFQEPLRRLRHRLIAFTISGSGQSPEKVTTTNLFFLRSINERTVVNVPYLLAQYLFRYAWGRKAGAQISGGHFIAQLGIHFGVIIKQSH
ncbi:hypothetical protein Tco_0681916 [Tanacetum coccineum]|uniref:Uncharacterized protein n=1 Tax=Tanacetum coccineum TaxID=301880 RepID=A0ABQ4XPQ2_9ASTR